MVSWPQVSITLPQQWTRCCGTHLHFHDLNPFIKALHFVILVQPTILNFWHSGLSARAPECQKNKNSGLDQYGAETFEHQQFGTADAEGVKLAVSCYDLFHNLPLPSWFLHRYQLILFGDRGTGAWTTCCEQQQCPSRNQTCNLSLCKSDVLPVVTPCHHWTTPLYPVTPHHYKST